MDVTRIYTVKARLQQACDAGALAGRRSMTDTSTTTPLDATATAQAIAFFKNNFHVPDDTHSGWMQTTVVATGQAVFTPSKTPEGQVAGTASVKVPMAVMKIFGFQPATLTATCEARYDVADSDIMFVLDTTGSMACTTANDTGTGCGAANQSYTRPDGTTGYYAVEQSGAKIQGLRASVLNFYDTLASAAAANTQIRYGFVTYASTANVGYLLQPSWLVSKWNYQTRVPAGDVNNGGASQATYYNVTQSLCNSAAGRSPASGYDSSGTATVSTVSWQSSNKCTVTWQPVRISWNYGRYPLDVSQYVTGATIDDPTKITSATSKWQGCIEERPTTASSSFSITNLPPDLDPDLVPVASVDANGVPTASDTRWRPMFSDTIYYRGSSLTAFT